MSPLFFFNDTATTEIYTLSLHDALPIYNQQCERCHSLNFERQDLPWPSGKVVHGDDVGVYHFSARDRKSTRLNSSHGYISYAVFCLKKKNNYDLPLVPAHQPQDILPDAC